MKLLLKSNSEKIAEKILNNREEDEIQEEKQTQQSQIDELKMIFLNQNCKKLIGFPYNSTRRISKKYIYDQDREL